MRFKPEFCSLRVLETETVAHGTKIGEIQLTDAFDKNYIQSEKSTCHSLYQNSGQLLTCGSPNMTVGIKANMFFLEE